MVYLKVSIFSTSSFSVYFCGNRSPQNSVNLESILKEAQLCSILCGQYNEIFIRYILVKSTCQFWRFSLCCTRRASLRIQSFLIAHRHSRRVPAKGALRGGCIPRLLTNGWGNRRVYSSPISIHFILPWGKGVFRQWLQNLLVLAVVQRDRTKQDFKT